MTYDPHNSRNRLERRGNGGTMLGIAVVFALFAGMIIWVMSGNQGELARTNTTTPTTTGQGTTAPTAPSPSTAQPPANR
jgi:hypothetical protein